MRASWRRASIARSPGKACATDREIRNKTPEKAWLEPRKVSSKATFTAILAIDKEIAGN
jgi:hypothetical protein